MQPATIKFYVKCYNPIRTEVILKINVNILLDNTDVIVDSEELNLNKLVNGNNIEKHIQSKLRALLKNSS